MDAQGGEGKTMDRRAAGAVVLATPVRERTVGNDLPTVAGYFDARKGCGRRSTFGKPHGDPASGMPNPTLSPLGIPPVGFGCWGRLIGLARFG